MSRLLKHRIITASILIPAVALAIFILPFLWFALLSGLVLLLGAWEWAKLMTLRSPLSCALYVIIVAVCFYGSWFVPLLWIMVLSALWWLVALALLLTYPKPQRLWTTGPWLRGIMGILVLMPLYLAINALRSFNDGAVILLFVMALVWVADIGAYFFGRAFGRHKLLVQISPGKTGEGVLAGVGCGIVWTIIGLLLAGFHLKLWFILLLLAVITICASVLGDLFESMLKRLAGLKDSGQILPGHGGFLDRIDSLTAALPIFTLGLLLITML